MPHLLDPRCRTPSPRLGSGPTNLVGLTGFVPPVSYHKARQSSPNPQMRFPAAERPNALPSCSRHYVESVCFFVVAVLPPSKFGPHIPVFSKHRAWVVVGSSSLLEGWRDQGTKKFDPNQNKKYPEVGGCPPFHSPSPREQRRCFSWRMTSCFDLSPE